jgi:hypothetical protein
MLNEVEVAASCCICRYVPVEKRNLKKKKEQKEQCMQARAMRSEAAATAAAQTL